MRPLKLILQAFGPYAGKEVIDFTELENRTMFVISGKTGAGKTTIFDGICFAIFGEASGNDRASEELRSQFADEDLVTEVSLQFSLRDRTYFIRRRPKQFIKKQRGDGFREANSTAELYQIEADGKESLLASSIRDTETKISQMIQLDVNQFRQILMIPQGDFRKLLISNSVEKEQILQKLFHTEIYRKIADQLKVESSELEKQVRSNIEMRNHRLKSVETYENEQLMDVLSKDEVNDKEILALLEDVQHAIVVDQQQIKQEIKELQDQRDIAKANVDRATSLLADFNRKQELLLHKEMLGNKQLEMTQLKTKVQLAKRAEQMIYQDDLCHKLKKELTEIEHSFKAKEEQLQKTQENVLKLREHLAHEKNREEEREKLKSDLIRLEELKLDVYSFAEKQAVYRQKQSEIEEQQKQLKASNQQIKQLEQGKLEREARLEKCKNDQSKLYELENKQYKLHERIRVLRSIEKLNQEIERNQDCLSGKETELRTEKSTWEQRDQQYSLVEKEWLQGQAHHLALQLHDGEQCPVCGSVEHPNPQIGDDNKMTEADVKQAREQLEISKQVVSKIEMDIVQIKTKMNGWTEQRDEIVSVQLGDITPFETNSVHILIEQHSQQQKQLEQELTELKQAISTIKELQSEYDNIKEQLHELQEKVQKQNEKTTTELIESAKMENELTRLGQAIPESIRSKTLFDQKLLQLQTEYTERIKAYEQAKEAVSRKEREESQLIGEVSSLRQQVESMKNSLTNEREQFIRLLHEYHFKNYDHFNEAKILIATIEQMETRIQSFEEDVNTTNKLVQEYKNRLKGQEKPDLHQLTEMVEKIDVKLREKNDVSTRLTSIHTHNDKVKIEVEEINNHVKEFEEKFEVIGHLSQITRGQNTLRLTFERYVLATFLEQILLSANARLTQMTNGRFYLLRKEERSKGNVQSGLELLVYDQFTGSERHVKTLSGGESFKASLSLALGLADVVQEYAGGVSLETMFIDEGFGTLDPESLDQAVEALMDIQSSGRLVGIISHVPELKERIGAQLEVTATQVGSVTSFHFL